MNTIYIITGQTATGKTKYALDLAKKHNGELINCDSRQVYTYLDIVTGKDLSDNDFTSTHKINNFDIGYYTVADSKIWLYDIVDPHEYFSSYDYRTCALYVIKNILSRKKTPILVGGTYFYIKHLLYGLSVEAQPDWELRKKLESKTVEQLQSELMRIDKDIFTKMNHSDRFNPRRLMRKVEIALQKNPETVQKTLQDELGNHTIIMEGFRYKNREQLQKKITQRVEERLKNGAIEETESLIKKGYSFADPGLKTLGYQQILQFLHEEISLEEMKSLWITKEIQYAKRQYTFMKKNPQIIWHEIQ